VPSAHRVPPGFVLLMVEADDAHFQDATKVPVTSISVPPTVAANAAKRTDAISRPSADPTSARAMVGESDARSRDVKSRLSPRRTSASSTEGGRSASRMVARRWPGEGHCTVLRTAAASDANWRDATASPLERRNSAEPTAAVRILISMALPYDFRRDISDKERAKKEYTYVYFMSRELCQMQVFPIIFQKSVQLDVFNFICPLEEIERNRLPL